jgi:hypothetical protein
MDDGSTPPARSPEPARPAASTAVATTDDDDILEGIVVPGDTPPAPDAPTPPRAPDA